MCNTKENLVLIYHLKKHLRNPKHSISEIESFSSRQLYHFRNLTIFQTLTIELHPVLLLSPSNVLFGTGGTCSSGGWGEYWSQRRPWRTLKPRADALTRAVASTPHSSWWHALVSVRSNSARTRGWTWQLAIIALTPTPPHPPPPNLVYE